MNILWITLESILPANSGGRLGVYKRLEQVAQKENIYLFYPFDNINELSYVTELKKYCIEVHAYHRKKNYIHALLNLGKYPFTVASREFLDMQKEIDICIRDNHIDLINVDFPQMCVNLLQIDTKSIPIILNEHNVEWQMYLTIAKSQKNKLKKMAYWIDAFRLKWFEETIMKKLQISMLTFVSDKDMNFMRNIYKLSPETCSLIPVGADLKTKEKKAKTEREKKIIYVGKMSYGPNIEAVTWFANCIFPSITDACGTVKFYIVGKEPDEKVKKLQSPNIIVTGEVECVDAYYEMADLVVLPLLHGGGVKVKLLEAISFQKIIISTPIGVEGTIYADGKSVKICSNEDEFSIACIRSLEHPELYEKKKAMSYEIFLNHYTWKSIGEKYIKCMEQLVNDEITWERNN